MPIVSGHKTGVPVTFIPAKNHGPAANFPINRIVMHGTVTPCVPGGARAVARMFANTSRDASTQYVVDPGEIVQAVRDDTIAYGAPPNKGAIHVEQCDMQAGPGTRWQDANHQAMLRLAAQLVARLCLKYDVPIRKLNAADLKAGRRGICGHSDVSEAWHQTTHVDPGNAYPWDQFLALVKEAANPKPAPAPAPTPRKGRNMFIAEDPARAGEVLVIDLTRKHWIKDAAELKHVRDGLELLGLDSRTFPVRQGALVKYYGEWDYAGQPVHSSYPNGYDAPIPGDE